MQKWEYLEVKLGFIDSDKKIEVFTFDEPTFPSRVPLKVFYEYLNKLGQEGWELVNESDSRNYIFKRPIE